MSASAPLFSEGRLSAPGKVFLLGEYAVLAGLPAVVACVAPRFELRVERAPAGFPADAAALSPFSPHSPAGRWLTEMLALRACASHPRPLFSWRDPYLGHGGFGASTAQFALTYAALMSNPAGAGASLPKDWNAVWTAYQEISAPEETGDAFPPSGADLAAQILGGVVRFERPENASARCEKVEASFPWQQLLVFSAAAQEGRKTATHEHLHWLARQGFPEKHGTLLGSLEKAIALGLKAIEEGEPTLLGQAFTRTAEALQSAKLEAAATTEDRHALAALPGVLGVKGTGALQSDGILVLLAEDARGATAEPILEAARQRGLSLVCRGLTPEKGMQWET